MSGISVAIPRAIPNEFARLELVYRASLTSVLLRFIYLNPSAVFVPFLRFHPSLCQFDGAVREVHDLTSSSSAVGKMRKNCARLLVWKPEHIRGLLLFYGRSLWFTVTFSYYSSSPNHDLSDKVCIDGTLNHTTGNESSHCSKKAASTSDVIIVHVVSFRYMYIIVFVLYNIMTMRAVILAT